MKKIIILTILLILTGCSNAPKLSQEYFYMNTVINVTIYEDSPNILNEIDLIYKNYHELTSRYDKIDNLTNIYYINNILEIEEEVTIDKILYEILQYSKEMYKMTDKKLNIALGNPIDVWNEYKKSGNGIPSNEELINSGSHNLDDLILLEHNKIKKVSNIKLDLGAVAKGYATNIVKEKLETRGINKYLINAGGTVVAGKHYADKKYKIGLEDPLDNLNIYKILNVENKSITTSGSYIRNYEYNDKVYHHIIDNDTLYPMDYFKSVSVISDNSALGDVLSTYLFTIPYEEGIEYLKGHKDISVIWYIDKNNIKTFNGVEKYE